MIDIQGIDLFPELPKKVLPKDLNMKETKVKVWREFEVLRELKRLAGVREEPKLIPSYVDELTVFSNQFHSNVESVAIKHIEHIEDYKKQHERILYAFNSIDDARSHLKRDKRKQLFESYFVYGIGPIKLMNDELMDQDTFYKELNRAITDFAVALNVHVKKEHA